MPVLVRERKMPEAQERIAAKTSSTIKLDTLHFILIAGRKTLKNSH